MLLKTVKPKYLTLIIPLWGLDAPYKMKSQSDQDQLVDDRSSVEEIGVSAQVIFTFPLQAHERVHIMVLCLHACTCSYGACARIIALIKLLLFVCCVLRFHYSLDCKVSRVVLCICIWGVNLVK